MFLLANGQLTGIGKKTTHTPSQGDIDDRAFPGHPHRLSTDGIHSTTRVETDPSLTRTPGIVVLHTKTPEDLHASIIHLDWNTEMELSCGVA
jgi:hypothetical protein